MKKELIPPIQESDLIFPYKDEIILNDGFQIGNAETKFHEIFGFGENKEQTSGIFQSRYPFIKASAFNLIHSHVEDYESNIIRMLNIKGRRIIDKKWKQRDLEIANELALKWINTSTQTHFQNTIELAVEKLQKNTSQNILELGTGTGLFTLTLVDQLLKRSFDRFTIITSDINVSCISYAWMFKQYFVFKDLDIHCYIFTKENLTQDLVDAIGKRHFRSIVFVVSEFSETIDLLRKEWADLVISNHATSYLPNFRYRKLLSQVKMVLKKKGSFIEDGLNNYLLDIQSKRLTKRVILGRNRIKGKYETEYTVIQKEREIPTIVDMKSQEIDKACDWIRAMKFNPTFKHEFDIFQESLGKTQKTQRNLKREIIDHTKEHKKIEKDGIKDTTPQDFKTEIYITTRRFQKV